MQAQRFSLPPLTERTGFSYWGRLCGAPFREPLSGGFHHCLRHEGSQPIDLRSLGRAQLLLVPINVLELFFD